MLKVWECFVCMSSAQKIQISETTKEALDKDGGYSIEPRKDIIDVKVLTITIYI